MSFVASPKISHVALHQSRSTDQSAASADEAAVTLSAPSACDAILGIAESSGPLQHRGVQGGTPKNFRMKFSCKILHFGTFCSSMDYSWGLEIWLLPSTSRIAGSSGPEGGKGEEDLKKLAGRAKWRMDKR